MGSFIHFMRSCVTKSLGEDGLETRELWEVDFLLAMVTGSFTLGAIALLDFL